MAQFQNRCFSGPLTLDRYLTGGSDSGPLPHLANILVEYTRDHLAGMFAPCGAIWHTSSKGMPRHAHGRWALVRVCGVDVTDVTLSWWCLRWLVRKILE